MNMPEYVWIYNDRQYSEYVFFLHIQFICFQTKDSQLPGTCISGRSWDPSEEAVTK